jgi:hypothetical protein
MGITILASGSPETSKSVYELAQELAYAMGRSFDLEKAAPLKPDTVVLNVFAVAPFRGIIPNGQASSAPTRSFGVHTTSILRSTSLRMRAESWKRYAQRWRAQSIKCQTCECQVKKSVASRRRSRTALRSSCRSRSE